jgi:hypothetical protein
VWALASLADRAEPAARAWTAARRVGRLTPQRGGYACDMPRRVKSEVFADLGDPVLFPRLSEAKIERLAARGERRVYEKDELLFDQGMRDAPFFVIEHGIVDIIDRRPNEELWFARMDDGTFVGDVSMFTGEPTVAAGVAVEPTSTIVFERHQLREMLAEWPEFAELVLQTMTARRAWLEGNDVGVLRLIASRRSGRAFEVRDLLERNAKPSECPLSLPNERRAAIRGRTAPSKERADGHGRGQDERRTHFGQTRGRVFERCSERKNSAAGPRTSCRCQIVSARSWRRNVS